MSDADSSAEITQLLTASRSGDRRAREKLIELLYSELRRIAGHLMQAERPGHTLQPTALVHELLLRFMRNDDALPAVNKGHFIFMATRAMRNLLVDHARSRRAGKRGGEMDLMPIEAGLDGADSTAENLLIIHEVLDKLEASNARQGVVAAMRIFGGFDIEEIARCLGVTRRTIDRDWQLAKAWLHLQLRDSTREAGS